MRAGKLRHRIRIETPTVSLAEDGGQGILWSLQAVRWGSIEPIKMTERLIAEQMDARRTHRITLRGQGLSIDTTCRLVHESTGRMFQPTEALNPGERGIEAHIMAVEVV